MYNDKAKFKSYVEGIPFLGLAPPAVFVADCINVYESMLFWHRLNSNTSTLLGVADANIAECEALNSKLMKVTLRKGIEQLEREGAGEQDVKNALNMLKAFAN